MKVLDVEFLYYIWPFNPNSPCMYYETVFFWVIFETLPFPNKSPEINAVWIVSGLDLLGFCWREKLLPYCFVTALYTE